MIKVKKIRYKDKPLDGKPVDDIRDV